MEALATTAVEMEAEATIWAVASAMECEAVEVDLTIRVDPWAVAMEAIQVWAAVVLCT